MIPNGRLAVITGVGRGLGRSLVDEFSEAGWAVVSKDPRQAARELRELVDSPDRTSPRFVSLGAADLSW